MAVQSTLLILAGLVVGLLFCWPTRQLSWAPRACMVNTMTIGTEPGLSRSEISDVSVLLLRSCPAEREHTESHRNCRVVHGMVAIVEALVYG